MNDDEQKKIADDFAEAVNMTPKELEDWLDTDESKDVGGTSRGIHHSVRAAM